MIFSVLSVFGFGSNDEEVSGAEKVARAIRERREDTEKTGFFKEPDLVSYENVVGVSDHKIEVPVVADVPINSLQFDLPEEEGSEFEEFLEAFGLDVESVEELDGTATPLVRENGSYKVDY